MFFQGKSTIKQVIVDLKPWVHDCCSADAQWILTAAENRKTDVSMWLKANKSDKPSKQL